MIPTPKMQVGPTPVVVQPPTIFAAKMQAESIPCGVQRTDEEEEEEEEEEDEVIEEAMEEEYDDYDDDEEEEDEEEYQIPPMIPAAKVQIRPTSFSENE